MIFEYKDDTTDSHADDQKVIFIMDPLIKDKPIIYFDDQIADTLGYKAHDLIGNGFFELLDHIEDDKEFTTELFQTNTTKVFQKVIKTKNSIPKLLSFEVYPIERDMDNTKYIIGKRCFLPVKQSSVLFPSYKPITYCPQP